MKNSWHYLSFFFPLYSLSIISTLPGTLYARTGQSTSAEIIAQAYQQKIINRNTYLIQTLKSYFKPDQVENAYRSTVKNEPTRDITPLLDEARDHYETYSASDRAFLDRLLKRPTDPSFQNDGKAFSLPAPVTVFEPTPGQYPYIGDRLKFWYVSHNIADASSNVHSAWEGNVIDMAKAFDTVWKTEIDEMEYMPPLPDPGGAEYGGDTKLDVYLMDCGYYGIYGYVVRENTPTARESRLSPMIAPFEDYAPQQIRQGKNGFYCFMVMDNNFYEFNTPTHPFRESMQVTAAHEFFHVIQNGINAKASTWFKETSSTWMEDQVFDSVDNNRQYLNGRGASAFFYRPEIPLDKATSHWYGAWIWNEYLKTKWDRDTIRSIWDELDPQGNNDAITATKNVLRTQKGHELEDTFLDFAVKNYVQTGFYRDEAFYDDVYISNLSSPFVIDFQGANTHQISKRSIKVNHLSTKYVILKPGQTINASSSLTIGVECTETPHGRIAAVATKPNGQTIVYPIELDSKTGRGTVDVVDFSRKTITNIVLVFANASSNNNDNNARFYYSATLKPLLAPTPTPFPHRPEIVFSGDITKKITWSKEVLMLGNVSVYNFDDPPQTARLTVLPGTIVRVYNGNLDAYNTGELRLKGSENQPILFTSAQSEKKTGQWGTIRVQQTGSAAIENCTVEYGGGIEFQKPANLKKVVVHHSRKGISCTGNLEIAECTSDYNEADGFQSDSVLTAANCQANGNAYSGFHALQIKAGDCQSAYNTLCGYQAKNLAADRCVARNNAFNGFYVSSEMKVNDCLAEDHNPGIGFSCSGLITANRCTSQRNDTGFYGSTIDAATCTICYNEKGIDSYPTQLQPITLISLLDSLVVGNMRGGLYLNDVGAKGIAHNIITENQVGIQFSNSSGNQSNVTKNDIYNNIEFEIFNFTPYRIVVDANYWGDPTTTELKARVKDLTKMYDLYENYTKGSIAIGTYYDQPIARTGYDILSIAYPTNTPTPTKRPVTPTPTPTVTPTSTPYPEGFPTPTPTKTPIPPTPTPTLNPVSLYITDSDKTEEDLSGWEDRDIAASRQLVIRWPSLQTIKSIKTFDLYVSTDGGEFIKMNSVYSIAKYFKWWPVNGKAEEGPQFGHTYQFQVIVVRNDGSTVGPFTHPGAVRYLEGEDQPRPAPTPGNT